MEAFPGSGPKEEGLSLLKAGKISEAIARLEQALALDPDDAQLHMYLGAAYNGVPDKLHAIHHLEESLRLEETAKGYYNLGLVYESVHRVDEAVRQYRMALELDPNYANAQQALRKLHERFETQHQAAQNSGGEEMKTGDVESSNRLDDALVQYRRALIMDSNYANAQEGVKRLEARVRPQVTRQQPSSPAPGLGQTQVMSGPPPRQTQVMPPPASPYPGEAPVGGPYAPPPAGGTVGPPAFLQRRIEEQRKIQEAHHALMVNGLIHGSICGAFLFLLLGFLSAYVQFAMVSAGSGIASFIISGISGAIFGGVVGLWMGYCGGEETQGAIAGAVMRAIYVLILALLARPALPGIMIFTTVASGALTGAVGGYIIARLVDASIGQV